MKKVFGTLILFFLFFSMSSTVFSESPDSIHIYSEEELDVKLKQLGFPDDYVSIMHFEQKQDIIEANPVGFAGVEKTDYFFDINGELQEIKPEDYEVFGTIPVSHMSLFSGSLYMGNFNGRKTYRIFANWQWHISPWFAWTDKIALSYNSAFQTRVATNGAYTCRSYAKSSVPNFNSSTNCFGRPSEVSFGGAGWNYDIIYGADIRNSGYAQMEIETKSANNPSGTGIILSKYFHKTGFNGSLGLSIGYASINVSSGSGFDEAGHQNSWYY